MAGAGEAAEADDAAGDGEVTGVEEVAGDGEMTGVEEVSEAGDAGRRRAWRMAGKRTISPISRERR